MIQWNGIGRRIREAREKKGITQQGMADALHVKRETVNQWESESRHIKEEALCMIAPFLGVTSDYLLGLESEQSHDLHYICYYTGLSEEAVKNISEKKTGDYLFRTTISRFFENDDLCRRFFRDMQAVTNCYAAVKSELSGYSEVIDQAASSKDSAEVKRNLSQLLGLEAGNSLLNLQNAFDGALYKFSLTCGELFLEEREEIHNGIMKQEAVIREMLDAQDSKEGNNGERHAQG